MEGAYREDGFEEEVLRVISKQHCSPIKIEQYKDEATKQERERIVSSLKDWIEVTGNVEHKEVLREFLKTLLD